jgi:hypothetical protein
LSRESSSPPPLSLRHIGRNVQFFFDVVSLKDKRRLKMVMEEEVGKRRREEEEFSDRF